MAMNEKVKSFSEKMWAINSLVSRDDFVKAFEMLVKVVVKVEENLVQKINKRLAELQDGKDGRDGKDGKNGERGPKGDKGEDGISIVGPQGERGADGNDGSPDTPEQIREKILPLSIEDIKNLRDELDELRKLKTIRGGLISGGVSAMGVRQAFKYIAHTEEPSGLINGVNTTYTLQNDIFWIAGFTLNGEQIAELPNFTYAGRTITFTTAIPAAYSGKDFECKYIG